MGDALIFTHVQHIYVLPTVLAVWVFFGVKKPASPFPKRDSDQSAFTCMTGHRMQAADLQYGRRKAVSSPSSGELPPLAGLPKRERNGITCFCALIETWTFVIDDVAEIHHRGWYGLASVFGRGGPERRGLSLDIYRESSGNNFDAAFILRTLAGLLPGQENRCGTRRDGCPHYPALGFSSHCLRVSPASHHGQIRPDRQGGRIRLRSGNHFQPLGSGDRCVHSRPPPDRQAGSGSNTEYRGKSH